MGDISQRLQDIVARAQRLEAQPPYLNGLWLPNSQISSGLDELTRRPAFQRYRQNEDAKCQARTLLHQHDVELDTKILDFPERTQFDIIRDSSLSFHEHSKLSFRQSLWRAVLTTEDPADDPIFDSILAHRQATEAELHRSLTRPAPASLSIYSSPPPPDTPDRSHLSDLASFLSQQIVPSERAFGRSFADSIRKAEGYGVVKPREARWKSLADALELTAALAPAYAPAGALAFLEAQRRRDITQHVNDHLRSARRSPVIGIIPTIEAFLQLRYDSVPTVWAVIFYALRCGEVSEAARYGRASADVADFVLTALAAFPRQAPDNELVEYLHREVTLPDCDAFKALVLAVLARVGPLPETEIAANFEDWAWLRLRLLRGRDGGLLELRRAVAAVDRWDGVTNPFMAGYARLVVGDYARALSAFLHADVQIDESLHIALAMHAHGLVPAGDVAPHLLFYAKAVFPGDQTAALRYLAWLADDDVKIDAIARLVVELPNGRDVFETGVQAPPIAAVLDPVEIRQVLALAAEKAVAREDKRRAVALMALARNYVGIIEVECRELVQIVNGFHDVQLLAVIRADFQGIRNAGIAVPLKKLDAMDVLIGLAGVTLLNKAGKYSEAVKQLEDLNFFPTAAERLHEYRERLRDAEDGLADAVPRALVNALKAYAETFKALPAEAAEARATLKEKGDLLIRLSGMLNVPQSIQKEALDLDNELHF
jgi:hypothetical protein